MGATQVRRACDTSNRSVSSSINEVIRAVLNLLFFYEKILHAQKAQKAPKAQEVQKSTKTQISEKVTFSPSDVFMRIKTLPFLFLFAYMCFCA